MIEREEIEAQAELVGVHHANIERDYVFGWLIKAFYENDYLAPRLIFKGGNCMRKAYYPNTRFSSDLDFSVEEVLDQERFETELNNACMAAQSACGVCFETEKNTLSFDRQIDDKRQSYKGRIYFKDFYGNQDHVSISVRVDITDYERIFLSTTDRPLIHPYSDKNVCVVSVRCMSIEELLANKLKCLIQRRHSFDLYDLVYSTFFERSIDVDRSLVLSTFLRKTIFERSPGAAREILLGLPLAFFQTAWNKYITCPISSRFDFDRASEGFKSAIMDIFGSEEYHSRGVEPFYPSHFRNIILEAGSGKRLMQIVYDGIQREIEPYALAYKRRRDGNAFEYFYAWDRTGGSSSGVGIKQFFHHKIQNLELTDRTFDPQFPIELSKAGELPKNSYFGGSRQAKRASFYSSSGALFTLECPYCQKRFKRKTRSNTLNPHKDVNGYNCSGRIGYFV